MTTNIKELMENLKPFGTMFGVAANVQVHLADPLPAQAAEGLELGEDFPHEIMEVYRTSNGLGVIAPTREAYLFDWNQFIRIDEMHEEQGFVEAFPGVYTVGVYGEDLILVDTIGTYGNGNQAVYLTAKNKLFTPPTEPVAKDLHHLLKRLLAGEALK